MWELAIVDTMNAIIRHSPGDLESLVATRSKTGDLPTTELLSRLSDQRLYWLWDMLLPSWM